MKALLTKLWNTEPVRIVGGMTTAWLALVAYANGTDQFTIPVWVYVTMVVVIPVLTEVTRNTVTAPKE